MNQYDLYNGTPPHVSNSDTSKGAAKAVRPKVNTQRENLRILVAAHEPHGLTGYEIAAALGWPAGTATARRRELTIKGILKNSGRKRKNFHTKLQCSVWVLGSEPTTPGATPTKAVCPDLTEAEKQERGRFRFFRSLL